MTASIEAQIARDYRWNFLVNTFDGAFFNFAMSFFSSSIVLPLFVSHFTTNPLVIGLIGFIGWAGVLVPQMFTANKVERASLKKFFPVNLGFFYERLPVILIAPVVFFLAASRPLLTLVLFFALYTWHNLGAGLIIVGWQDMVAKIIPLEKRGRFFGAGNFIGSIAGILGALAVPLILGQYPFPLGYVYIFAIAALLFFLSWLCLSLTREPRVASSKPAVSQSDYLRTLPAVLRADHNFRAYLLSQIIFSLSYMATGFLVVYTSQTWDLPDARASAFIITMQIGAALAFLGFGFLADRRGHKISLEISWLLGALLLVLAVAARTPAWFYAVFFLRGAVVAGTFVSGIAIVYEFTGSQDRPTYIGLANTLPGIAVAVAPLFGGWLAGWAGYRAVFTVAAVLSAASWALLRFAVREPRHSAAS